LFLEGFNERGNGLLALREFALGCLLESGQRLVGEPEKFGMRLPKGLRAEGGKSLTQIGQGFGLGLAVLLEGGAVEFVLFGEQLLGGGAAGFRGGLSGGDAVELPGEFLDLSIALACLMAQFLFHASIGRTQRSLAPGGQPADERAQACAHREPDEHG
jgi:hypothetical protein